MTVLTKEPETIEWLDGLKESDVLWDIGANVGVYSLYAGLRGSRVIAFEPVVVNCYALNRNIELNRLQEKVTAYCVAFDNRTSADFIYMGSTEVGGALHGFAKAIDWQRKAFSPKFKQGSLGLRIDDFVDLFPFPTHIKLDVDGIEGKIIEGAQKAISDPRFKSILVEIDSRFDGEIVKSLASLGMRLAHVKHGREVEGTQFESVYNYIFVK